MPHPPLRVGLIQITNPHWTLEKDMYNGHLYYDQEDNFIEVHQLIIRNGGGSVSLTTTWDDQGKFSLDATLTRTGNRLSTGKVRFTNPANQVQAFESEIDFVITEESEREISIQGVLHERGTSYKFEGDLSK